MPQLQAIIEEAFERRADITPRNVDAQLKETINTVIEYLDKGKLRVAEKINGQWVTHQWLKKAVLLSFRIEDNAFIKGGFTNYFDKVPSKFADYNSKEFREGGFRVVPPAAARRGAYIAKNVVLMPSYCNIGAYVDEGTMVDTWATVGSCAQIGKNVHLSRRRRYRRRAGTGAGQPHHHRRQLLHRRTFGSGRGRDRGRRLGHLDGRFHRPKHQNLRPRNR